MPTELRRSVSQPTPRPAWFRGTLEVGPDALSLYLPPRGAGRNAREHLYISLGFLAVAGAAVAGMVVWDAIAGRVLLGVLAAFLLYAAQAFFKLLLANTHVHRWLILDPRRVRYQQDLCVGSRHVRLWSKVLERPRRELVGIYARTMAGGAGTEDATPPPSGATPAGLPQQVGQRVVILEVKGKKEVVLYSPDLDARELVDWVAETLERFLDGTLSQQPSSGEQRLRPRVHRPRLQLGCGGCGAPLALTAEAMMKQLAPCAYCGARLGLPRLPCGGGGDRYEFEEDVPGSPMVLLLDEDSLRVTIPGRARSDTFLGQAIGGGGVLLVALTAAGLALWQGIAAHPLWLVAAAPALFVVWVSARVTLPRLGSLLTSYSIHLSRERLRLESALLGRRRRRSWPLDEVQRFAVRDPFAEGRDTEEMMVVETWLDIQVTRGEVPRIVVAEYDDEVYWLGRTLQAYLDASRQLAGRA